MKTNIIAIIVLSLLTTVSVIPARVGTVDVVNQEFGGTTFSWTVTAVGTEARTENRELKTAPITGSQSGRGTVTPYKDYVGWYSIGLEPQQDWTISKESIGVSVKSNGNVNVMISVVSIEYYNKIAVISGEVRGITKVETTNETGTEMKNHFLTDQTVYIMGGGFEPSKTYPLYVVNDADWVDGMPIPERVDGSEINVTTDENGKIASKMDGGTFPRGTAWNSPLIPGAYDIVIDVNGNGMFDKGVDALDYYNSSGFIVDEPLKIKRFMFEVNPKFPFDQSLNFLPSTYAAKTDMWNGHYYVLDKAKAIRQIRQNYIATVYRNILMIWAPGNPEYNETEYNLFIKNGWILKDAKGSSVFVGDFEGFLVDVGNPSYQEWLGNWYKDYCDMYGVIGAYLDNFLPCKQLIEANIPKIGSATYTVPINPRTGQAWTDEDYTKAMISLSVKVKNAVGSRLVLANTIFSGSNFYDIHNEKYYEDLILNSTIDGIVFEAPWSSPGQSDWYDEGNWTATLNCAVWLEDNFLSRDKILMLISENAGCNWPSIPGTQVGDPILPSGVSKEQYVTYCFASTLLFAKSNKIYQNFGFYTPEDYPQSLFPVDLGNPLGAYSVVGGTHLYGRQFSKGIVLVNPTNVPYTVGLSTIYQNISGNRVTGDVTLAPHTAQILTVNPSIIADNLATLDTTKVGTVDEVSQEGIGAAFSWKVTAVGTETWSGTGQQKTTPVTSFQWDWGTVSPYEDSVGWYSIGLEPKNGGTVSRGSIGVSVKSQGNVNVMISVISIEYYDKIAVISGEVRGITKVETTNKNGIEMKNHFLTDQTVYIMGGGFEPSKTYPLYVVNDADWVDGMPIPERVQGTETAITTDRNGRIVTWVDGWANPVGMAWTWPPIPGAYDIVIDVNRNGIFDKGIDALDYYQSAGFIVEPPTNLAVIPAAWQDGYYHDVPKYVFVDNTVVYDGNPSLRLQTGGGNDPVWHLDRATWIVQSFRVKPGDHVVARAWMKTDPSSTGNKDWGARIGVDFHGTIDEYGNSRILDGYPGNFVTINSEYVHWGTTTWTMRQYDFIVPNKFYITDQYINPIPPTQIDAITMWFQARPGDDAGNAWIANAELYVNPDPLVFGKTNVGAAFDQNDGNAKSASSFTCSNTGNITWIAAYVSRATSTGTGRAAIYADSGGLPGALISQTTETRIGTSFAWVNFTFASPVRVTSGTVYWLAVCTNDVLNLYEVSESGVRVHNGNAYSNGFSNPFGVVWGTDTDGAMSIYASGVK